MKSLKQFITESLKTYQYTIKIAGTVDKNFLDMFKYNLNNIDLFIITGAGIGCPAGILTQNVLD